MAWILCATGLQQNNARGNCEQRFPFSLFPPTTFKQAIIHNSFIYYYIIHLNIQTVFHVSGCLAPFNSEELNEEIVI